MHMLRVAIVCGVRGLVFAPAAAFARVCGLGMGCHVIDRSRADRALQVSYTKEYGKDSAEMQADALAPGARVVVVDDLLATGESAAFRSVYTYVCAVEVCVRLASVNVPVPAVPCFLSCFLAAHTCGRASRDLCVCVCVRVCVAFVVVIVVVLDACVRMLEDAHRRHSASCGRPRERAFQRANARTMTRLFEWSWPCSSAGHGHNLALTDVVVRVLSSCVD